MAQTLSTRTSRHRQAGFTLIEVLVVLVLVAMTSGILFQAMQRAYGLQQRFGTELFNAQQGQMATDWYRQTVQGLFPDQPDGRDVFKGSETEFSGLSSNPLSEDYGAPTPIHWKIQRAANGSNTLMYLSDQKETVVLFWPQGKARFVYLDEQRAEHETWPPTMGLFPQLPAQIQLQLSDVHAPQVVVATPMGPTQPPAQPLDVFGIKP